MVAQQCNLRLFFPTHLLQFLLLQCARVTCRETIRGPEAAVMQLGPVKPGSPEIKPVCDGRFPAPSYLQSAHHTDAQTPVAAERGRDGV